MAFWAAFLLDSVFIFQRISLGIFFSRDITARGLEFHSSPSGRKQDWIGVIATTYERVEDQMRPGRLCLARSSSLFELDWTGLGWAGLSGEKEVTWESPICLVHRYHQAGGLCLRSVCFGSWILPPRGVVVLALSCLLPGAIRRRPDGLQLRCSMHTLPTSTISLTMICVLAFLTFECLLPLL
jgi:hypothetical protein